MATCLPADEKYAGEGDHPWVKWRDDRSEGNQGVSEGPARGPRRARPYFVRVRWPRILPVMLARTDIEAPSRAESDPSPRWTCAAGLTGVARRAQGSRVPRFFNTSGPNNPADHYTLPVLARLPEV